MIFPRRGQTIYMNNQSGYGHIMVKEVIEKNALLRLLLVDDVRQSASYMEDGKHNELVFKYTKDLMIPMQLRPEINNTLLIGGAGFSIPKYYISHFPGKHIDVVELNPTMYQIALLYFYLDELYDDYNLNDELRLEVFIEDGNDYLRHTKRRYDLIINDAYVAGRLDNSLIKERQVMDVKKALNPGGIYAINMITALKGEFSVSGLLEWEILKKHFKYTDMFQCKKECTPFEKQNCILIASDEAYPSIVPYLS